MLLLRKNVNSTDGLSHILNSGESSKMTTFIYLLLPPAPPTPSDPGTVSDVAKQWNKFKEYM